MRAAIYGAGAMGTVLGAFITRNGGEIDLINRNAEHVNALKRDGAHITGTVDFRVAVSALLPEEMTGHYDVIFLMTKQRQNAQTVTFLKDYLTPNGVVVTMQNGLPEQSVADIIGRDRTLGCAISWGATMVGKGEAMLTSSPRKLAFSLGSPYTQTPRVQDVVPLLSLMGKVTVERDFLGARWAKLAVNSAFSSLSALTGLSFGEVAERKDVRPFAQELLHEVFAVARQSGITVGKVQGFSIQKLFDYRGSIKKALSYALLPLAMKNHRDLYSGMLFDLKKGRGCDIDFICGAVIDQAKECHVATPLHERVLALVHEIERGQRQIGEQNISALSL